MLRYRKETYCGICGVPAHPVDWNRYQPDLLLPQDTRWISKVNIIGRAKGSRHDPAAFLTSFADWQLDNSYILHIEDQTVISELGSNSVQVYERRDKHEVCIPFHNDCYRLLSKVAAPHTLNTNTLYETLEAHHDQKNGFALDFDYGNASACRGSDRRWNYASGMGYLMTSPTDIPRIKDFIDLLLEKSKLEESESVRIAGSEPPNASNNALESLPSELFCGVLESLDYSSICSVRLASKYALNQTLSNGFWRKKFFLDMAWASEFLLSTIDSCNSQTDWFKVYKALRAISQGQYQRCLSTSRSLRNRARIWEACSDIVGEYHARQKAQEQRQNIKYEVLHGAYETDQPLLRFPGTSSVIWSEIGLMRSFTETRSAQPVITVFWSMTGELAGIGIKASDEEKRHCIGSKNAFVNSSDVQIPKDGWITELVIITRGGIDEDNHSIVRKVVGLEFVFSKGESIHVGEARGDKRVAFPPSGYFIVGFKLAFPMRQPIAKLGLLIQPKKQAPHDSLCRLEPHSFCDETGASIDTWRFLFWDYLWKAELPPRTLDILPVKTGWRASARERDDSLMEPLIFGSKESDLEMITAIGVDAQLRGFEICLDDGVEKTTRLIGNTNAMHYLSIDGRGGERILFCRAKINAQPESIRFVTNKGRQLIVGRTNKFNETAFPPKGYNSVLMGIYCHWSNRNMPCPNLEGIGAFTRPRQGIPTMPPAVAMDTSGRSWLPSAPSPLWREAGCRIYGQWQQRLQYSEFRKVPSNDAVVSFLDCSRPLESITVGTCHNFETNQLPVVSISFRYSDDQTTASVGPTKFTSPDDHLGLGERYYWCRCRETRRMRGELWERPHYVQEEWKVGGSVLKSVQLWLDKEGMLTGLQFTNSNGQESPFWGNSEIGSPLRLSLEVQDEGWSAGLKLFIDEIARGLTREDHAIVAVQLMVLPKSSA